MPLRDFEDVLTSTPSVRLNPTVAVMTRSTTTGTRVGTSFANPTKPRATRRITFKGGDAVEDHGNRVSEPVDEIEPFAQDNWTGEGDSDANVPADSEILSSLAHDQELEIPPTKEQPVESDSGTHVHDEDATTDAPQDTTLPELQVERPGPAARPAPTAGDSDPDERPDYSTRGTATGYSRDRLKQDLDKLCKYVYDLHLALGCIPYEQLADMAELGKLTDFKLTKKMILLAAKELPPCDRCTRGKAKNMAATKLATDAAVESIADPEGKRNLRIDILFTRSRKKAKAPALVVTDEVSGHTNIVYLPTRSTRDVEAALSKTIAFLNKHGIEIGVIKSDREGAFVELGGKKFRFQYTGGPGTHESVAEAVVRILKEMFVCKREGLSFTLPRSLYPKLMEHVCVLYNHRLRRNATQTPAEMVTGMKVSANDLIQGAFGRIALFKIPDEEVKKRKLDDLDSKAEFGVVVGFEPSNPRNLKVYLPVQRQIVVRRGGQPVGDITSVVDQMNKIAAEEEAIYAKDAKAEDSRSSGDIPSDMYVETTYGLYTKVEPQPQITLLSTLNNPNQNRVIPAGTRPIVFDSTDPTEYYVPVGAFERISLKQAKLCLPAKLVDDAVIQELVVNMESHAVWDFCSPHRVRGKHILRSMLFLKIKTTPIGDFDKLKARLVPDGGMQQEGEYERTSSPTVDFPSLAVVLSLTKYLKASISTVDVPAAYLRAPLKEEIYMRLDKTVSEILVRNDPLLAQYLDENGTLVVRLKQCIYGLRQSGAEWHDILVAFLKSIGYSQSVADRCVFYKHADGKLDLLTVHVDDLLFVYTNKSDFERIKSLFVEKFGEMKFSEGNVHSYLGMTLKSLEDGSTFVTQTGYARSLINSFLEWRTARDPKFKLRPYKTPSVENLLEMKQAEECDKKFKEKVIHFVYSLMYLAQRTRPDILFPVNFLTTMVTSPAQEIIQHLDRIFGYLNSTVYRGLLFGAESTGLTLFADAAYAIHRDGKSHSGIVIMLDKNPILVQSLKQKLVTLSSTEAELEALVSGLKRLQPIRRLLEEIQLLAEPPTKVMQDNKSTITIAKSGEGYTGKNKHMRVRYHAVAEQVANREIEFTHCPTLQMVSDMLSKPGGGSNFADLVDMIVANLPGTDD